MLIKSIASFKAAHQPVNPENVLLPTEEVAFPIANDALALAVELEATGLGLDQVLALAVAYADMRLAAAHASPDVVRLTKGIVEVAHETLIAERRVQHLEAMRSAA